MGRGVRIRVPRSQRQLRASGRLKVAHPLYRFHQAFAHAALRLCENRARVPRYSRLSLDPSRAPETCRAARFRHPALGRRDFSRAVLGATARAQEAQSRRGREARIRKPSRCHLPSPIPQEEEVVVKPPAPPEPRSELAQLQGLLILCLDLSTEVAKPDAWFSRFGQNSSDRVGSSGRSCSS